jgi:SAM-dependent methyltransferase
MRGHIPFDEDVEKNGRYVYTGSEAPKSSIVANALQTKMLHSLIANLQFKSILDVGCGDGTYTAEFLIFEKSRIVGLDPAVKAIEFAAKKWRHESRLSFTHLNLESLIQNNEFFDLIVFRGVLHHCDDPVQVLLDLNPILKLIEKVSPYHRAHSEKSFTRKRISSWLGKCGFEVEAYSLGLLVPYFFPAFLITPMLKFEPVLHKIPILAKFLFGTQVLLSKRV